MGVCASGMSLDLKISHLMQTPLFALPERDLNILAKFFSSRHYDETMVIAEEKAHGSEFFVVCSGEVELSARDKKGNDVPLCSKRRGTMFGHKALVEADHTWSSTATAVSDVLVLVLTKDGYERFIAATSPDMRKTFADITGSSMTTHLKKIDFLAKLEPWKLTLLSSLFEYEVVKKDEIVFRQGDTGQELYVIAHGSVDVFAFDPAGNNDTWVADLKQGQYFGEIALMVNMPRTATIICREDTLLLTLRKEDFENFLTVVPDLQDQFKDVVRKRTTELFKSFNVPFFNGIPEDMMIELTAMCEIEEFAADSVVFTQGDPGTKFFIVVYGVLTVHKQKTPDSKPEQLRELGPGEYFGEIALVRGVERTATVAAKTRCVLLSFSRDKFLHIFHGQEEVKADFELRLARQEASLWAVLKHSLGLPAFTKHLAKEYSSENIEFWKTVQEYKTASATERQQQLTERAQDIIQRFIAQDAKEQVNIPASQRETITKRLETQSVDDKLFDEAEKEILKLMAADSFKRFKNSSEFKSLLEKVGAYNGQADPTSVYEDDSILPELPSSNSLLESSVSQLPPMPDSVAPDDVQVNIELAENP